MKYTSKVIETWPNEIYRHKWIQEIEELSAQGYEVKGTIRDCIIMQREMPDL